MTAAALSVRAAARERPDAIALVEDGRTTTWSELARLVEARAGALAAIGVDGRDPDARVAVIGEGTRERVIDVLAAIELGAPLVLLHPRWTEAERAAAIDETSPRVVLGRDPIEERALAHDPEPVDPARPLAILYTSGTSGRARGAVLSRRAFLASAHASAANLPLGEDDRWLLAMTIAHVGGLSIVVRSLIARSAVVLAGPFHPMTTRDAILVHRPTLVSLVPTMLERLLEVGWLPLAMLRAVLLGGAACPERVLTQAIETGLPIRTTYGLTEACSQVTTARDDVRSRDDGAGAPLPGIGVRITELGTIAVRGPTMFDGWFPLGAHPPPFDADGWYDTGDLGQLDRRGRLHVLSRRTDLIVTGGENVYPAEVEAALERIEGVRAACVFGVDDERWGQVVAAALVVEPGAPPPEALVDALARSLARFKIPRRFAHLDAMVLGPSGKLDRRATAARAGASLRPVEARDG